MGSFTLESKPPARIFEWDYYANTMGYPHRSFNGEFATIELAIARQFITMKFLIQPLYNWYRHAIRHSRYRWWIILGTLLYLVSPFDLSPDVLPIIGWIDDGVVATLLVTEVSQLLIDRRKSLSNQVAASEPDLTANPTTVDINAVSIN